VSRRLEKKLWVLKSKLGFEMEWKSEWRSPSDSRIRHLDEILELIHHKTNHSIYVGCDSHAAKGYNNKYLFALVICLVSNEGKGNRYFYTKGIHSRTFKTLKERLTEEVALSAEIATQLNTKFPDRDITLHADSSSSTKHKSGQFTDMFKSWAIGIGCKFASKPDAWASSSIADRHSK
jgi:predicted RNase H-related nuclease YkuK (DUF458 family)